MSRRVSSDGKGASRCSTRRASAVVADRHGFATRSRRTSGLARSVARIRSGGRIMPRRRASVQVSYENVKSTSDAPCPACDAGAPGSRGACRLGHVVSCLTTRAGLPTATERGGMLSRTTLFAPTTAPAPIVTPGRITTFCPIQAPRPMTHGRDAADRLVADEGVGIVEAVRVVGDVHAARDPHTVLDDDARHRRDRRLVHADTVADRDGGIAHVATGHDEPGPRTDEHVVADRDPVGVPDAERQEDTRPAAEARESARGDDAEQRVAARCNARSTSRPLTAGLPQVRSWMAPGDASPSQRSHGNAALNGSGSQSIGGSPPASTAERTSEAGRDRGRPVAA